MPGNDLHAQPLVPSHCAETLVKYEVCCGGCVVAGRLGHENAHFPIGNLKNLNNLKSEHRWQARMPEVTGVNPLPTLLVLLLVLL